MDTPSDDHECIDSRALSIFADWLKRLTKMRSDENQTILLE